MTNKLFGLLENKQKENFFLRDTDEKYEQKVEIFAKATDVIFGINIS